MYMEHVREISEPWMRAKMFGDAAGAFPSHSLGFCTTVNLNTPPATGSNPGKKVLRIMTQSERQCQMFKSFPSQMSKSDAQVRCAAIASTEASASVSVSVFQHRLSVPACVPIRTRGTEPTGAGVHCQRARCVQQAATRMGIRSTSRECAP
jgi:hypothetical protein